LKKSIHLNSFSIFIITIFSILILIFILALIINSNQSGLNKSHLESIDKPMIFHRSDPVSSLEQIRVLENSNWTELTTSKLPYGYSNDVIWMKIIIDNPSDNLEEAVILLDLSSLDSIEQFQYENGILKNSLKQGDTFPYYDRLIKTRYFSFPISLERNSENTIYLRIQSSASLNSKILLLDKNYFTEYTSRDNLFFGLFFGFSIAILIYNVIILAFTSEFSFLLSGLTLLLYFLSVFAGSGFGYMYLYADYPIIQSRAYLSFNIVTNISMIYLFSRILALNENSPKIKMFLISLKFSLLTLLALHIYQPQYIIYNLAHTFNLISILSLTGFSFFTLKKDNIIKYYFFALSILFIGFLPIILSLAGFDVGDDFSYYSFLFSSSFILIIVTAGMGRKVYNYKSERDHYVLRLLRKQKQYNRNLERKVKEKTSELSLNLQNLSNDLELARSIQLATLPNLESFVIPNFQIAGSFLPRDRVGGDLYDLSIMDDGRIRAFVCDVTGHGIQAALVTMSIRAELDRIKKRDMPIEKILRQINRTIIASFSDSPLYASAIFVEIDRKNQKLRYASAGHPDQYLITKEETIVLVPQSRILGIHDDTELFSQEISITKPYSLYLFTDGIFESFNNEKEVFGEERFRDILEKQTEGDLQDKLNDVYTYLFDFVADTGFQDDVTMLFLRDDEKFHPKNLDLK
jgi:two-component system, sensor histidine kinase LadS